MAAGLKKINIAFMSGFYFVAGINHFFNPDFYLPLIPPYFPFPHYINIVSGIAEISLGIGVLFGSTRKVSATGIIILLLAFIPSHVYFIREGSCIGELCVSDWIGWIRLIIIHPLLILWAWNVRSIRL